jgi:hypothetical protein
MRWKEIIEHIDFDDLSYLKLPGSLQRLLISQNYKLLGSGAGGAVFGKNSDPNVIKVGKISDGWWEWANWAHTNKQECIPYVKSVRKYNADVYMVVMEKLKPLPGGFTKTDTWNKYCSWMLEKTGDRTYQEMYLNRFSTAQIKQYALEFEKEYPCLSSTLELIISKFPAYHLDLYGPENFMLRGNTLVITDPLSRKK